MKMYIWTSFYKRFTHKFILLVFHEWVPLLISDCNSFITVGYNYTLLHNLQLLSENWFLMDLRLVDTPPYKMAEKEKDSERRENGGIREEKRSLYQRGEGGREVLWESKWWESNRGRGEEIKRTGEGGERERERYRKKWEKTEKRENYSSRQGWRKNFRKQNMKS